MQLSKPPFPVPGSLLQGVQYMNPGLLISSSILEEQKIENKIIKVKDVNELSEVFNCLGNSKNSIVGLSCTCAWEYLECLEIARKLKQHAPRCKIFIAGWQIKSVKEQVFKDSPDIDYAILGDAEYTLKPLITGESIDSIPGVISRDYPKDNTRIYPKVDFKILDFSRYPEYQSYIPYVEESRNCPGKCTFCLNSCVVDRYQIVPMNVFEANVNNIENTYGKNACAVLLAANFGVSSKHTLQKLNFLKSKELKWNMELHIDNPWEEYLDDLVPAGISKLSVGFESASRTMLRKMDKTKNPDKYLERLEILLNELNDRNIQISLNTLFDYRETPETIAETIDFLEKHKGKYRAAKMNFMIGFEGLSSKIPDFYQHTMNNEYTKKIHAYPMLPQGYSIESMVDFIEKKERYFKVRHDQRVR